MNCDILKTPHVAAAEILLLMNGKLTVGKLTSSRLQWSFVLIKNSHVDSKVKNKNKKQTSECWQYSLLQSHLNRCDADNRRALFSGRTSSIQRKLELNVWAKAICFKRVQIDHQNTERLLKHQSTKRGEKISIKTNLTLE